MLGADHLVPRGKNNYPRLPKATWGERFNAFRKSDLGPAADRHRASAASTRGIFTPTEAAAMSAVYAFVIAVFVYKDMTLKDVPRVLLDSANMSAMLLYIITNAVLFSFLMTHENIPQAMADWITRPGPRLDRASCCSSTCCCCSPAT